MKEETLLKLALSCSIAGICFLFIVVNTLDYREKQIINITSSDVDSTLKFKGVVAKSSSSSELTTFDLEQQCRTKVLLFKKNMTVPAGTRVEVIGKVSENTDKKYGGDYEIIAQEVKIVK